ncbi:MAG: hypothetical protein IT326_06915 [Anaerolineae bacterium]|nr:hypothetical protein [Anaerolineae bacterium]
MPAPRVLRALQRSPFRALCQTTMVLAAGAAVWGVMRTGGECGALLFGVYSWPRLLMIFAAVTIAAATGWAASRDEVRAREMVFGAGLMISGGVVAVLLLNLGLALTEPPHLSADKVNHPLIGVWRAPNATHVVASPEGEYRVWWRTDRYGIPVRVNPNEPRPDALRVMLLGDSLMQGDYLPMEQTMSALLEARLGVEAGRDVQVINFGMNVTGPLHYLMEYRAFKERFDPDVVITALYLGNDFTDDARLYHAERIVYGPDAAPIAIAPYVDFESGVVWNPFTTASDPIEQVIPPAIPSETWKRGIIPVLRTTLIQAVCNPSNISRESWFVSLPAEQITPQPFNDGSGLSCAGTDDSLRNYCFNYAIREVSRVRNNGAAIYRKGLPEGDEQDIARTLNYLMQLADEVESDGRRFVLVIIPHGAELPGQQAGITGPQGIRPGEVIDGTALHARLQAFCLANDLACTDLLAPFSENSTRQLYLHYDIHWAPEGNRVAAEAIAPVIAPLLVR